MSSVPSKIPAPLSLLALLTLAALCPAAPPEEPWITLFDGKTLSGWHVNPSKIDHGKGGRWYVEDLAIVCEQDPPGSGNGGILLTDRTWHDFELLLEVKIDWGADSGLFLRCNEKGQCFQVMIDYHERGNVGHIFGERSGSFLARPFDIFGEYDEDKRLLRLTAKADAGLSRGYRSSFLEYTCTPGEWLGAWRVGDWNTLRVHCQGAWPTITTWINGVKICIFDGARCDHPKYDRDTVRQLLGSGGHIALQVHGEINGRNWWPEGAKCRWKNIRIRNLSPVDEVEPNNDN